MGTVLLEDKRHRNDFLFLFAVSLQLVLILSRMERIREVAVILVFHILATIMEWFKTSPEIGSWQYPSEGAIFRIYQVPLFAGFLYSSVGSYIARAWRLFDFTFTNYPPMGLTVGLSVLAYLNFFTHHYFWDCRWILIGFSLFLFARCQVHFTIVKTRRRMPLLIGLLAVTAAIWIAENIGTYARAWVYPNQEVQWQLVHPGKLTAWYLLMLFSFVLVSLIHSRNGLWIKFMQRLLAQIGKTGQSGVMLRLAMIVGLFAVLFFASPFLPAAEPGSRLDPDNLLVYRNGDGAIRQVKTTADWEKRRSLIVRGMEEVMGPFPGEEKRVPLDLRVEEETDLDSYRRLLITYQSEPGSRTPAFLCLPKSDSLSPAVLCLHPTDNRVGHRVVVGLGGKPGRQYAAELAERGYVTLSPSYPHLADYWPNLGKLGFSSGTMKAIWDNSRGIDLLASLDSVDMSRGVGAIGHSLGGHNAIYTAVFEPRISVVASSCGFDSFRDYYGGAERVWFFGKGWCQLRYMPRMSDYRGRLGEIPFDFPELLGALAPRPLYVNAPLHDSNFQWQSVKKCAESALAIYRLFGKGEDLIVDFPDVDHHFPEKQREKAYQVLDAVLKPDKVD